MKKITLFFLMIALMTCFLVIAVNATTPNTNGDTFTLSDGTVLPLWDTDGNGLIWYKSTVNQDDGYANYDCVANNQTDTAVTPNVTYTKAAYNRGAGGKNFVGYQLNTITINDGSTNHTAKGTTIVLVNLSGKLYDGTNAFTMFSKNFENNTALEACYLDESTQFILSNTFKGCTALRKVNLDKTNLIEVGEAAFNGCTSLVDIVLPESTLIIGHYPFQNTGIIEFTIPQSVVQIVGSAQFNDCKSLERVYGFERLFTDGILTYIPGSIFRNCSKLQMPFENGIFPEQITRIDASAFASCASIGTQVILPNGLTTIGQSAFNACTSLEKVVLGASFSTWASYDGFKNCSKLKEVYIPATMTSVAGNVFNSVASNCVFYFTGTKDQLDTVKANTNSNNTAFLNAYNNAISASDFEKLENKSGRYIVYDYNVCLAFYNGHSNEATNIVYENGFDKVGVLSCACSRCATLSDTESAPIITMLGYATDEENGRITLSSGFIVDTELLEIYNTLNETKLVVGILFANSKDLAESVPANLEGIMHRVDEGFATYNYVITFPNADDSNYEEYATFEFVVSAFICENENYVFFSNNTEDTVVSTLNSGFTTTTLEKVQSVQASVVSNELVYNVVSNDELVYYVKESYYI